MKEIKRNSESKEENEFSTIYLLSSGHQPQMNSNQRKKEQLHVHSLSSSNTQGKSLGEKKDFLSTDKAKHLNKLLINQRNDKILILGTAFAQKEFGLNIRKTYLRSQKVVTCCVSRGASFVVLLQLPHGNRQVGVLSFVILISVIK